MTWRFWESSDTRIARKAANWRAEMEAPESQEQVEKFEAWLLTDPAHQRAYAQSETVAALGQRLSSETASSPGLERTGRRRALVGFASAGLIMMAASMLFIARPAALGVISNNEPAVRTWALADGSRVTLDTGSAISVPSTASDHRLKVNSGRVRLTINLSEGRSLAIETPEGVLHGSHCVLDVIVDGLTVRARLIAGRATLTSDTAGSDALELPLGNLVRVADHEVTAFSDDREDANWPIARVSFADVPLDQILAKANKSGNPTLAVSDPTIGNRHVTAVLDLRDTRALARKLAAALGLRVIPRGNTIILSH